MSLEAINLYKIYYDEASFKAIAPPYLPLDNRNGSDGWFELMPILNFLETHELDPKAWYGFVSPKFPEKANLELTDVTALIAADPQADVALFSSRWLYLLWFDNVWTQGEAFHPGLIDSAEKFLRSLGHQPDLRREIGDFRDSVFSNFIVARPAFWQEWRQLARAYVDYTRAQGPDAADNRATFYIGPATHYPLRTFVQERLACWVLSRGKYHVVHPDYIAQPIHNVDPTDPARGLRRLLRLTYASKKLAKGSGRAGRLGFKIARKLAVLAHGRKQSAFKGARTG